MSKEAYYFSHDANARNDEKILMLRAEHGMAGYGVYWALLEMMFESADSKLYLNKIKGLAVSYNIDITLLKDIINTAIEEQLFVSDGDKFWSESLIRRKNKFHDMKAKKSEAGKKGMAKRWANKQNDNTVIENDNTVITENNKGKEIKEKEIKENKINNNTTTTPEKIIWDFWDSNGFGYNNLNAKNKLAMFLDEGFPTEVIIRALEIATENNKVSFSYVNKILIDWDKRNLKTIEAVKAAEAEREQEIKTKQQPRYGQAKKPLRTEYIPDYMDDSKQQENKQPVATEELQERKQSIQEKLKAFRGE